MSLQPLLPVVVLVVLLGPLLAFTVTLAVRASRTPGGEPLAWWRRSAVVALLVVVGLGPSVPRTDLDTTVAAVDVFFVVDRTGSMAAEDYDGTDKRLDGVKADILAITDAIPGARFSVVAFDSQATRQLPLTTDTRAVRSWVDTYDREVTVRSRGSLVDRPLDELTLALEGAAEERPANARLVFFMSDGENTSTGTRRSFSGLAPLVDGGAVLGYGTTEGGRMKSLVLSVSRGLEESDYISDPSEPGRPDAVSRMDPVELAAIADELGVPYEHRTSPTAPVTAVDGIDPETVAADGRRSLTSTQPVLWPFALALAVLLALEVRGQGSRLGRKVGATDD